MSCDLWEADAETCASLPPLTQRLLRDAAAAAADGTVGGAWALHREAVARVAAGEELLLLTLGSPDTVSCASALASCFDVVPPSQPAPEVAVEAAVAALRSPDPAMWNYSPACGSQALRNLIAASHGVEPSCVMVTGGGQASASFFRV